ncbi:hypothetical protein Dsin_001257 [Dipteronia sinensis]|uniref:PORR domain-containing protein n=1 Tax=Dipteronia sinensis TaxID=43782 RepID=A0AAE0B3I5_9ROSI|nr:hypothetical protein Dsin_001257 [Dipteronia sinensis]
MPVLPCPPEESLHPYNDLPFPNDIRTLPLPMPPTLLNATKSGYQLCVRLTPAAAALAKEEMNKLQKLLMLSSHHRLLLSNLGHISPELGLPPNFRSHLCNDYQEKFKIVDPSYGRALDYLYGIHNWRVLCLILN